MRKDLVLQTGGVDKNYIIINFKFNLLKLFNIKNNFFKTIYMKAEVEQKNAYFSSDESGGTDISFNASYDSKNAKDEE